MALLTSQVAVLFCLVFISSRWARVALGVLSLIGSLLLILLTHQLDLRRFPEKIASFSAEKFGFESGYRVLPVASHDMMPWNGVERGLFHSASVLNYESLTGYGHKHIPKRFSDFLHPEIPGQLPESTYRWLLRSPYFFSLGLRDLLVSREDEQKYSAELKGFKKVRSFENATVYRGENALGEVYSAHEVAGAGELAFESWLKNPTGSRRAAFVEGWESGAKVFPMVEVKNVEKSAIGKIKVRISAPQGGFLVFSFLQFPGWVQVLSSGEERPTWTVNRLLQGVTVEPGTEEVNLLFRPKGLLAGLFLAIGGIFLLCGWVAFQGGVKRCET